MVIFSICHIVRIYLCTWYDEQNKSVVTVSLAFIWRQLRYRQHFKVWNRNEGNVMENILNIRNAD